MNTNSWSDPLTFRNYPNVMGQTPASLGRQSLLALSVTGQTGATRQKGDLVVAFTLTPPPPYRPEVNEVVLKRHR